ncbi:MAG: hypothetical protein EPO62_02475 [Candidatus Nitrosotenuis sp.]|nr:MAG: hypothetical protein EPO62_02475 [Candidatus Nitrosotenuis sp.]
MTKPLIYAATSIVLFLLSILAESSQSESMTKVTGILIPLYTYPGTTWDTVVAAKNAHPSVPVAAVINPHNGPGNVTDTNYVSGIQKLQSSGVVVMGYVYTNYTARDPSLVINDIDSYKSRYPQINGIFFDEMSNVVGNEGYYWNLSNYAKSVGFTLTVGNAGADIPPSYVGKVDNILIYDNSNIPSLNYLGGWHIAYDKSNFSSVSYGVGALDQAYVKNAANYVGYIYISNGSLPNPWDTLPPYFDGLVSSVGDASSVSIRSSDLASAPISGLWNEIYSNNVLVRNGLTPTQHWLVSDLPYLVCAADYQNYVFDHWENMYDNRCATITPVQNMTFTAYYKVYSTLNLRSVDLNGTSISGIWVEIYSNGTKITSGFTPQPYQLSSDSQYLVCVSDYQNYFFDHWDDQTVNRCRIINIVGPNMTVIAHYRN